MQIRITGNTGYHLLPFAKKKLRELAQMRLSIGMPVLNKNLQVEEYKIFIETADWGEKLRISGGGEAFYILVMSGQEDVAGTMRYTGVNPKVVLLSKTGEKLFSKNIPIVGFNSLLANDYGEDMDQSWQYFLARFEHRSEVYHRVLVMRRAFPAPFPNLQSMGWAMYSAPIHINKNTLTIGLFTRFSEGPDPAPVSHLGIPTFSKNTSIVENTPPLMTSITGVGHLPIGNMPLTSKVGVIFGEGFENINEWYSGDDKGTAARVVIYYNFYEDKEGGKHFNDIEQTGVPGEYEVLATYPKSLMYVYETDGGSGDDLEHADYAQVGKNARTDDFGQGSEYLWVNPAPTMYANNEALYILVFNPNVQLFDIHSVDINTKIQYQAEYTINVAAFSGGNASQVGLIRNISPSGYTDPFFGLFSLSRRHVNEMTPSSRDRLSLMFSPTGSLQTDLFDSYISIELSSYFDTTRAEDDYSFSGAKVDYIFKEIIEDPDSGTAETFYNFLVYYYCGVSGVETGGLLLSIKLDDFGVTSINEVRVLFIAPVGTACTGITFKEINKIIFTYQDYTTESVQHIVKGTDVYDAEVEYPVYKAFGNIDKVTNNHDWSLSEVKYA